MKELPGPLILKDIFHLVERQAEFEWLPFREKVEICPLYLDKAEPSGPAAALIRFQPGGRVDLHEHIGFEYIIVLSGSQTDQNGTLEAGSLMIHPPGTNHCVVSEEGCLVLAIYEKRVFFLLDENAP